MEIWKDIQGYEKLYKVSNFGRIKSLPRWISFNDKTYWYAGRIMKPVISNKYACILLSNNGNKKMYKIHRLMAIAFIPLVSGKPFINHKNGIKTDNRLENLEWCNASENQLHAIKMGLVKKTRRYLRPTKKVIQKDTNNSIIRIWDSNKQIVIEKNFKKENIIACCNGKLENAYGYIWEYVN